MGYIHTDRMVSAAARHMRIARRVLCLLRDAGIDSAECYDKRDASAARLYPPNLRVADRFVLCRPVGYKPARSSEDALFLASHPFTSWLQLGASDVSALVEWLKR